MSAVRALVAAAVLALAIPATAEPLPPGAIGIVFGGVSGTGADAKRMGAGFYGWGNVNFFTPIPGFQASWQPTTTERRWGWTIRGSTMFGRFYGGTPQVQDVLQTVQMDFMVGLRARPWQTPSRYLTLRVGGELLRANEPILLPNQQRAFTGAIASTGIDQYVSSFLFSVDVRYGLIASEPGDIALLVSIGVTGP